MGAWLKIFKDGTKENGSDEDIANGNASWSRGQLNDIETVKLFNFKQEVSLSVSKTSWHQFNRYQAVVAIGKQRSTITHRVIQAEITLHHVGQSLVYSPIEEHLFWATVRNLKDFRKSNFLYELITKHHVGKWLTVILPEENNPTITFSTRGKMYDNQHISRQRS